MATVRLLARALQPFHNLLQQLDDPVQLVRRERLRWFWRLRWRLEIDNEIASPSRTTFPIHQIM